MNKKNQYLEELGIQRKLHSGNFVTEKKLYRMFQRHRYGFDYRDIFNMDTSFAEWLYSHMRMYKENSVHDDTANIVVFEEKKYTIEEAVDWIIEKTGTFLKYSYYADARFDYITMHPIIGKLICKMNPSINSYLYEDDWIEADEWQIEDNYIKAGRLFFEIQGYCWL